MKRSNRKRRKIAFSAKSKAFSKIKMKRPSNKSPSFTKSKNKNPLVSISILEPLIQIKYLQSGKNSSIPSISKKKISRTRKLSILSSRKLSCNKLKQKPSKILIENSTVK